MIMNRRYFILTTDDDEKTLKEVKQMLEQMGAEQVGSRSGMQMGGSSGSRGGYRRDERGYPMDITNLRSGNRGYHDNEQEVEMLEQQIRELKMRKKQLEAEEEGNRYGAYGPYPY